MKGSTITFIGAGIALLWGGHYFLNAQRTKNQAAVVIGAKAQEMNWQGAVISVKFNIKNPGNRQIEMAIPLIKIMYKGSLLGTSSMSEVDIPDAAKSSKGRMLIPANGETGDISTTITFPLLSMVGFGANLVAIIKNRIKEEGEKVKLNVETISTIYTPVGVQYAYNDKQVIAV